MEKITIFVDGCSINNPGYSGIGVVGYKNDEQIFCLSCSIGIATNNVAEYRALIEGLDFALENGHKDILIYSDNMLVIEQVYGRWKLKNEELKKLCQIVWKLKERFDKFELKFVPGKINKAHLFAERGARKDY